MALVKLGKYIKQSELKNSDNALDKDSVVGLATSKSIIPTKADLENVTITSYKLLPKRHFAYVPDTSRRGDKVSMGFNTSGQTFLVSSISIVFYIEDENEIDSEFLFMYFNRSEFDRYTRFNSWGSTREAFSWEDMCDIDIDLPDIEIQREYVAVYKAMVANQKVYERSLEDLKFTCDVAIEKIDNNDFKMIGKYIKLNNEKNKTEIFTESDIRGFNEAGNFIMPMRTFGGEIKTFRIINYNDFVYNPRIPTTKFPVALNKNEPLLVSPAYVSFNIIDENELNSDYLLMIMQRPNFSRKVLYNTWGSSTPFINHNDLCDITIPVPKIEIQKSIANIYNAYLMRRQINEELKNLIKDICPILIKGAILKNNRRKA